MISSAGVPSLRNTTIHHTQDSEVLELGADFGPEAGGNHLQLGSVGVILRTIQL